MSPNETVLTSGAAEGRRDNPPSPDELPPAHKTACLQCRHQKIKCKPSPDGSIVCARCQKMRLSCIYQGRRERTSRVNKDQEAQEPPRKRRSIAPEVPASIVTTLPTGTQLTNSAYAMQHRSPVANSSMTGTSPASSSNNLSPSRGYPTTDTASCTIWSQSKKGASQSPTLPRHLEKVHLESGVIEDLFSTFFLYYAFDVPILDPMLSPNDYHNRSPLLFWSIMTVASRRYAADPTLLHSLAATTFKLALLQADSPTADIHTVESLLLLLSWQFPSNSMHEEAGYVLSGAMIHLAFRFGLHRAEAGQDYVRVRLELNDGEVMRRRMLWATCVTVYHEIATMIGNSCLQVPTPLMSKETTHLTCSDPRLRLQLQAFIARANNAFTENGTSIETPAEERTLQLLIRTYEDELKELESSYGSLTQREQLFVAYARMQIQVMHLFRPAKNVEHHIIAKLYSTAVRLVEILSELDKEKDYLQYVTAYIMRSSALASCILLRIIKTPFSEAISLDEAKTFFLQSLKVMSKMTVANNDGPARASVALSRLWRSDRVFKDAEGNFHQDLRVRSRNGASILWDTMAWCREGFGAHAAYNLQSKNSVSEYPPSLPITSGPSPVGSFQDNTSIPTALTSTALMPPPPLPLVDSLTGLEQIPLSFDWTMDDWLFSPEISFTGEWSAPVDMMESHAIGL